MDVREIPKTPGDIRVPSEAEGAQLGIFEGASVGRAIKLTDLIRERFIAAEKFEGQKNGYVFTVGLKGTGYYLEEDILAEKRRQNLQEQEKARSKNRSNEGRKSKFSSEIGKPSRPERFEKLENTEKFEKKGEAAGEETKEKLVDVDEIIRKAEEESKSKETFDARAVKKLSYHLQKKFKENSELRLKFPNDPERFMNSEIELDLALSNLMPIINSPNLYTDFLQTGISQTLVEMMVHENIDIAASASQFIQALTDSEDNEDWVEDLKAMVGNLLDCNIVDVSVLKAMQCGEEDEEEENLIFNVLSILDNMIDIVPVQTSNNIIKNHKFVLWMIKRLNAVKMDSLKLLCAELLSQILQIEDESRNKLLNLGIFEALFHETKKLHTNFPKNDDGFEFFENIFNGLCCCLLTATGKESFLKVGGIDFMLDVVCSYKKLRLGAFRVIEFSAIQSKANCERIVATGGLKTIFSIFMGKLKINSNKNEESKANVEEMVVNLIAILFQELPSTGGGAKDRVASKFVENEFEKTDKLMELYFKYQGLVQNPQPGSSSQGFSNAVNASLLVLQQICIIIANLWNYGDRALRQRILLFLHQKSHSLSNIKAVLSEMAKMIEGTSEDAILNLISTLGNNQSISNSNEKTREKKGEVGRDKKRELKRQIAMKRRERDDKKKRIEK